MKRLWAGAEAEAIGAGRPHHRIARDRTRHQHRQQGPQRSSRRGAPGARAGEGATQRRRQAPARSDSSRDRPGAGEARRSSHARRSGVAAALDVQEHAPFVRGAVHAAQAARRRDGAVGRLLKERGYSLQGASKTVEGAQHPDRNAQFEHINAKAQDCIERGVPFISVDTKKKELVGNFRNAGQEWQREGEPELVDVHDFPNDAVGKAIPYGVYDVAANDGLRERRR